jgi:AraC-like DNA-binding protein
MLLYSPHCPYHAHNDEPYMDYHTLIFRFTLGDQTRLPARFAASSTLAVARLLNMIHKQVTQETPDQRTIKTLLLEIMEHAHHPKHAALRHPQAGRVLDAMQLIRKQLGQPFSLASLAKQLHCSPSHLSHLFKQHADTSAGAYYLSLKMDHAKQLLCDPASSLKQVAEQMGYATIHQFTRRFTAVVGIPPGEFRKQQLQVDAQRVRVVSTDGGPVA